MIATPAAYPTTVTCHPAYPLRTAHRCAYARATAAATTATIFFDTTTSSSCTGARPPRRTGADSSTGRFSRHKHPAAHPGNGRSRGCEIPALFPGVPPPVGPSNCLLRPAPDALTRERTRLRR